jgi:hypothetical protein
MHQALLMVHTHIRRDLEFVQRLAAQVADGLSAEHVSEQLEAPRRGGMLW